MKLNSTVKLLAGTALCCVLLNPAWSQEHAPRDGMHRHFGGGPMGGPMGGRMGHRILERALDELDLSSEQRDSVDAILASARPQMNALREQMQTSRQRLMDTRPDDPGYASVVAESRQNATDAMGQLIDLGGRVRADIHQLLTAEQIEKAEAMRARMQQRMQRRMQRRFGDSEL